MKLAAYIGAGTLITVGLSVRSALVAIVGACLFMLAEVAQLFYDYKEAQAYRQGTWEQQGETKIEKATGFVRGTVFWGGIIASMLREVPVVAGILWFGVIACWLLAGWIVKFVAAIPLRMGYGGWKVYRPKTRRRR